MNKGKKTQKHKKEKLKIYSISTQSTIALTATRATFVRRIV